MFQMFYPDRRVRSVLALDPKTLFGKGIRGIIFDIDNTLVPHGAPATDEIVAFFAKLRGAGLRTCLVSNNGKERVEMFNERVGSPYIYKAGKPKRSCYIRAMEKMGTSEKDTLFVGDQLFTDIWGARRAGLSTVLVDPIHPKEEIQIVLKRYLEKIVLWEYEKKVEKTGELL